MLMQSWILNAVLASSVSAWYIQPWTAAGPNDSRGPCPMLNSLANHGYLPHDGKNISPDMFGDAVVKFNVQREIGTIPAQNFLKATGGRTINLADLNKPGILQHIASITRLDYTTSNPHLKPNARRIEDFLRDSSSNFVTVDSIATTRLRLEAASRPKELTASEHAATLNEAAFILTLFMQSQLPAPSTTYDPSLFLARKDALRIWMNDERFPTELGWSPPNRMLTLNDFGAIGSLVNASMAAHSADFNDDN